MNMNRYKKILSSFVLALFLWVQIALICPISMSYAQVSAMLPQPGTMVGLSTSFVPALIKGMNVNPRDPFNFSFIIDQGDVVTSTEDLEEEASKLIKYFLASLTISEQDLWVNLSPHEKDRIIPEGFSRTEMGRDLLAQDYLLKQITSSLLYPEDDLGEEFWEQVNQKAMEQYGTIDIDLSTFNKVWIVPEFAEIYENGTTALIVDSKLKVLTEFDYLSNIHSKRYDSPKLVEEESVTSKILREIVVPEIEKEVNDGENFAPLRQIYHSLILATWFKRNLKDTILSQVYVGKSLTVGVETKDKNEKEKIYQRYLEAFKQGAFDYVKDEYDYVTQSIIPKKYFSGGALFSDEAMIGAVQTTSLEEKARALFDDMGDRAMLVKTDLVFASRDSGNDDQAMLTPGFPEFKDVFEKREMLVLETVNPQDNDARINFLYDGEDVYAFRNGELIGHILFEDSSAFGSGQVNKLTADLFDPIVFSLDKRDKGYGNISVAALANIAFAFELPIEVGNTNNPMLMSAYKRFLPLEGASMNDTGFFPPVSVQKERLGGYEFNSYRVRTASGEFEEIVKTGKTNMQVAEAVVEDIFDFAMLTPEDRKLALDLIEAMTIGDEKKYERIIRFRGHNITGDVIWAMFNSLMEVQPKLVSYFVRDAKLNQFPKTIGLFLASAIVRGKTEIAKIFFEYADPSLIEKHREGLTLKDDVLGLSIKHGRNELAEMFIDSGYFSEASLRRASYLAIMSNNKKLVRILKPILGKELFEDNRVKKVLITRKNTIPEFFTSVEWEDVEDEDEDKDSAMSSKTDAADVGGIDFNPTGLEIKTNGSGIEWQIPSTFNEELFQDGSFNGFAPSIYSIIPITGINMILGSSEDFQSDGLI